MAEPSLHHVTCASPLGLHKIAYTQWGDPDAPVLLCVHGLKTSSSIRLRAGTVLAKL